MCSASVWACNGSRIAQGVVGKTSLRGCGVGGNTAGENRRGFGCKSIISGKIHISIDSANISLLPTPQVPVRITVQFLLRPPSRTCAHPSEPVCVLHPRV